MKINKFIKVGALGLVIFLAGCEPSTSRIDYEYRLPEELKDCEIYSLNTGDLGGSLKVVRCPNSTTTSRYMEGKVEKQVITIDGAQYQEVK